MILVSWSLNLYNMNDLIITIRKYLKNWFSFQFLALQIFEYGIKKKSPDSFSLTISKQRKISEKKLLLLWEVLNVK